MEIAENWLQSGEQIDAIVANNDEMAIGAIRALEALEMNDDVIVAGVTRLQTLLIMLKQERLK